MARGTGASFSRDKKEKGTGEALLDGVRTTISRNILFLIRCGHIPNDALPLGSVPSSPIA
jgi:hypothetical protein